VLKYFSGAPPENSGGAENAAKNSGTNGKNFFCYIFDMSMRHPVWAAEINVTACTIVWFKNPYRNPKFENSQDYAQKLQRNCTFMNSASGESWQDPESES
jgi:hypothetical protein